MVKVEEKWVKFYVNMEGTADSTQEVRERGYTVSLPPLPQLNPSQKAAGETDCTGQQTL